MRGEESGERRKLPSRVQAKAPADHRFLAHFEFERVHLVTEMCYF